MQINCHTHHVVPGEIALYNTDNKLFEGGYFSVGIHPYDAAEKKVNMDDFRAICSLPDCLAIGESGLDKLKGPDLNVQREVFIQQVKLAEELEMPLIIHCVKAWNELRQIKRELKPVQPWIFHGFSKATILEEVLEEGLYVSFGANLLVNEKLQQKMNRIPDDRFFLETDDLEIPISVIYEKAADLKKLSLPVLEENIELTFKKVFKKWLIGSNAQRF